MTRRSLPLALLALAVASPALATPSGGPPPTPFEGAIGSAKAAMMGEPRTALDFAMQGLGMATKEPEGRQRVLDVATAQWLEGEALLRLDRANEAEPVLTAALSAVSKVAPNSKLQADLLMAQGGLAATRGQVSSALSTFQTAYRIFGTAGQPRGQAKALQFIGSIYQDARDYPRVLQYYAQSAELYHDDPALLMAAYNNTARAYKDLGRFQEAEADFRRALQIAREAQSPSLQARILSNLAAAQVEAGHPAAAARSVEQGLQAVGADPDAKQWRPFLLGVSGQIALKQGQLPAAKAVFDHMFQGVDLATTAMTYRDFHKAAYETYRDLGDQGRALAHLAAWKRLDDQAGALAASTNAALMSAQFDYANQLTRISNLQLGQMQRDRALVHSRFVTEVILLTAAGLILCLLSGAIFWILRSRNAVRQANAQLSGVNASLEKALQARSDFLATTSHEIRTPLNGILGMTQVMLANRALEPEIQSQIRLVHNSGEAMRDLVNDILDVAKIESGKLEIDLEPVDLAKLLTHCLNTWRARAREKGLRLELEIADDIPGTVMADPGRLRQILLNLLSNAIKFTEAGEVILRAETVTQAGAPELALHVRDTGIGIAPADQARVFETFSQIDSSTSRLYAGTGLGLSICRSLAQAMGGEITLQSQTENGSTFTVRLPLRTQTAIAPTPSAERIAPPSPVALELAGCGVLIVDANPLSRSLLKTLLQPKVSAVEVSDCLSAAEARLSERPADLVVAHLTGLARDEDSLDVVRRLRAVHAGVLVAMAQGPSDTDLTGWTALGVAEVIVKPAPAAMVLAALDRAWRSQAASVAEDTAKAAGAF